MICTDRYVLSMPFINAWNDDKYVFMAASFCTLIVTPFQLFQFSGLNDFENEMQHAKAICQTRSNNVLPAFMYSKV